jgi:molybdopterin-guanine dinucleotide biosynthesis protein A
MAKHGPIPGITGAILVGGKSSRMGRDKAFLEVGGHPLVAIATDVLRRVFERVILAGDDGRRFASLGLPSFPDRIPGSALGGLLTALSSASDEWVFVVPCDLPEPSESLIRRVCSLREGHDAVVPRNGEGIEPLFACYHRRCIPVIEDFLAAGSLRFTGVLERLRVHWLEGADLAEADGSGRSFVNLNTPEDVARFRAAGS